jgi:predicted nucleic acid-binding protein
VKLLLVEEGSNEARALWNAEEPLLTSWITFVEASAAIGAAARNRRISRRRATESLRALDAEWRSVVALEVDELTSLRAGGYATRHGLRGMDAIHLASAALLARAQPTFVTWDADLRVAALAEGLEVSGR